MKTLKLALLSFVAGVVLSVAPIVTYACAADIWVADTDDCHVYHRYVLVGSSSGGGVSVCAYEATGTTHIESGSCDGLPFIL